MSANSNRDKAFVTVVPNLFAVLFQKTQINR